MSAQSFALASRGHARKPLCFGVVMKYRISLVSALAAVAASGIGRSETVGAWTLDQIPWQAAAPNGTKFALLEGDRQASGKPFSYAFYIPAGVWDSAHSHSATARVFVAKGALRLGYGPDPDHARATTYPAGSFVVVPARAVHFDGADVETVIIGVAHGPWATTYLDGSKPASAGTPLAAPR
jgi:hypothetical protein